MASSILFAGADYQEWLKWIKQRIHSARMNVALAANGELIRFYWELGSQIADKQTNSQWGDKLISQLSRDLSKAFPDMRGLSTSNLKYCLRFFQFYADTSAMALFGQQPVDQIPWGHNILVSNIKEVEFVLRDMSKPMGVSEYKLVEVPDNLKGSMSTGDKIEGDLQKLKEGDSK